jgi:hypothetical protein
VSQLDPDSIAAAVAKGSRLVAGEYGPGLQGEGSIAAARASAELVGTTYALLLSVTTCCRVLARV